MALGNIIAKHNENNNKEIGMQFNLANTKEQKQALEKELTELKTNHTKHVEAVQKNYQEQIAKAQGEAKKELEKKQAEFKSKYAVEANTNSTKTKADSTNSAKKDAEANTATSANSTSTANATGTDYSTQPGDGGSDTSEDKTEVKASTEEANTEEKDNAEEEANTDTSANSTSTANATGTDYSTQPGDGGSDTSEDKTEVKASTEEANTEEKDNAEEEANTDTSANSTSTANATGTDYSTQPGDGGSDTSEDKTKQCIENIKSSIASKNYFLFQKFKMKDINQLVNNIDTTCLTDKDKEKSIKNWYDANDGVIVEKIAENNINDTANTTYSILPEPTKTDKCKTIICKIIVEKIAEKIAENNINDTISAQNLEINATDHKDCYKNGDAYYIPDNTSFIDLWNNECVKMYDVESQLGAS